MLKVEFTLGTVQRGETPKVDVKRILKMRHVRNCSIFRAGHLMALLIQAFI